MNRIILCGAVENPPELSHRNYGRSFCRFTVCAARLSGACDHIPVLADCRLCENVKKGDVLYIEGEIRSFNDREAVHNRLKINVWAQSIHVWDGDSGNTAVLRGTLCRPAVYRRTPFGREISDLMLCVPRQYHSPVSGRYDYLPCIAWGSVARLCASLPEGTEIELEGRLQSRQYVKLIGGVPSERTAYEISISSVSIPEDVLEDEDREDLPDI